MSELTMPEEISEETEQEEIPEQNDESPLIANLRKIIRNKDSEIQKLRKNQRPPENDPGEEPTLVACDMDEDEFKRRHIEWYEKKKAFEDKKKREEEAENEKISAWNAKANAYLSHKDSMNSEYEVNEAIVKDALGDNYTCSIIDVVDDPKKSADIINYLGENPDELDKLVKDKGTVRFVKHIVRLDMKQANNDRGGQAERVKPERTIQGRAPNVSADDQLTKLRKEAEKTGDHTKVSAYLRELKRRNTS